MHKYICSLPLTVSVVVASGKLSKQLVEQRVGRERRALAAASMVRLFWRLLKAAAAGSSKFTGSTIAMD